MIKRLIFDQFFRESKKNLEKLYKYPYKSELKRKRKGIKKGKTWGNTLLIDLIVKIQKPNIEGLTNFRKTKSERERRKEKRRKNSNL